jgi:uncharacterized protein
MATPINLHNKWVLVTGASSGLGAELARQLVCQHGAHVLLLARREAELKALKNELQQQAPQQQCQYLCADLSRPETYDDLLELIAKNYALDAVILNAGVTWFEEDRHHPWQDFQNLLHTNVSSVVFFTRAFLNYFDKQKFDGAILVVGSMAGMVAVPYQSAYSGSKAFLSHYCQGLCEEISNKDYSLSLFSPGGIDTELNSKSGLAHYFSGNLALQSVESCATEAIETLRYRKTLFVPRFSNRLQIFASKLFPKKINNRVVAITYRKALKAKRAKQNA